MSLKSRFLFPAGYRGNLSPIVDPKHELTKIDVQRLMDPKVLISSSKNSVESIRVKQRYQKSLLGKKLKRKKKRNKSMRKLGLDLGTKHIVLSQKVDGKVRSKYEVNGYLILPRSDSFTEQLLIKQGVPYVTRGSQFIAIGSKAEQLAYSFNKTMRRPMAEGGISKTDDDAQEIIAIIIRSIIGKLDSDVVLYYCTTAKPVNSDYLNVDFHRKVVKLIVEGYSGESRINAFHINEARCLILEEPGQAIGISWGAGTVTVHAGVFGMPIFEFSVVGSGDFVDLEAAKRFGYDPLRPDANSSETPTSICRRKEGMSLRKMPDDNVGRAIYVMYEILIENVVKNIIRGFNENKDKFRFDQPIPVINAGGSSIPDGFLDLVSKEFGKYKDEFTIPLGEIRHVKDPLLAVSRGCLIAAELHKE